MEGFKVAEGTGADAGRHLVAAREFAEGEVIMEDAAVVVGPAMTGARACLGCLSGNLAAEDRCPLCLLPLCRNCQADMPKDHKQYEYILINENKWFL